ncbi:MAG: DUF6569 family protein [Aquihabitans sp.]
MPITPTIHLGVPTQAGPLTVFPVWTDAPAAKRAMRTTLPKSASVGEVGEHSEVERLQLHHTGKSAFLLPGATVFGGGWQHRALVHGVLVDGPVDLDLDVRCVEAGRWHGDVGAGQGVHQRRAPLAVRGALRGISRDIGRGRPDGNVFSERQGRADQSDVWNRVGRYQSIGSSQSLSLVEMTAVLEPRVDDVLAAIPLLDGQRGILVGIGGHPALLEVFDHTRTLAGQIPAILGGVLADAMLVPARPTPGRRARTFARRVSRRRLDLSAAAGAGFLAEAFDDLADVEAVTTRDEHLVHLSALNIRHDLVAA